MNENIKKEIIEIKNTDLNFKNDFEQTIIIIGSGIAGITSAEEIRKYSKKSKIIMITSDNYLPYMKILLSKRLCTNSPCELKNESWFKEKNIQLKLNKKVKNILCNENKIILYNGEILNYDKLIIATGAKARKIPINGNDKRGVFFLRTKEDFTTINEYVKNDWVNDIVILGGGILGIEIATSLRKINKKVTIIEYSNRIMYRQLDENGSKIITNYLNNENIKIITSESIEEIFGTGNDLMQTCAIKLSNSKEIIQAQMIIETTGIKQDLEIFKNTKLTINKGLIVNSNMQTNVKNIYACGDIAEFEDKIYGLWSIALEQGKIAGKNVIGNTQIYENKPIATNFTDMKIKIFSIGDFGIQKENKKYCILEFNNFKENIYKKFYFINKQIVGGILIGNSIKIFELKNSINLKSTIKEILELNFLD